MAFNSKLSKNIYSNSYKKFKEICRPDKLGNKNPSRMRGFLYWSPGITPVVFSQFSQTLRL